MRKALREALTTIRDAGAEIVGVEEGRHTRVRFRIVGRTEVLALHQGTRISSDGFERMLRAQLRRKLAS